MKLLIICVCFIGSSSFADSAKYFVKGSEVSKLEAVKALMLNGNAQVSKCSDVYLSDKLTLKVKKTGGAKKD